MVHGESYLISWHDMHVGFYIELTCSCWNVNCEHDHCM